MKEGSTQTRVFGLFLKIFHFFVTGVMVFKLHSFVTVISACFLHILLWCVFWYDSLAGSWRALLISSFLRDSIALFPSHICSFCCCAHAYILMFGAISIWSGYTVTNEKVCNYNHIITTRLLMKLLIEKLILIHSIFCTLQSVKWCCENYENIIFSVMPVVAYIFISFDIIYYNRWLKLFFISCKWVT